MRLKLGAAIDAFNKCMDMNACRDKRLLSLMASVRASKRALSKDLAAKKITQVEYRAECRTLTETAAACAAVERHNSCALAACRRQLLDVLRAFIGVNEAMLLSAPGRDPTWTRDRIARLREASLWNNQELRKDLTKLLLADPHQLY